MQVQNISMYSNYKTLNSTKKAVNKTDISFNGRRDDRYFPEFETTQSLNRAERYFAELCSLDNQFRHFAKQYTINIGCEKRKVTIIDGQYFIHDKNGKEVASMKLRRTEKGEFDCDDKLYKKAKNGPILIESLKAEDNSSRNFLIREAIKASKRQGSKGCIVVKAKNTEAEYSRCTDMDYEKAYDLDIPIFHYKGFKGINEETKNDIDNTMKTLSYFGVYIGPKQAYMYLPSEKIDYYLNQTKHMHYFL